MKTKYYAFAGLTLLVGCGGGGGGGGSSSGGGGTTPLTLKVNDLTATLNENDSVNIGFDINKTGADYSLQIEKTGHSGKFDITEVEPGITWSIQNDELKIDSVNIDKKTRSVIATLTASVDGQQSASTFELQLTNGTLDKVINTVEVYVNDAQNIISLSELNDVSSAYGKVLELLGHSVPSYSSTFDSAEYSNNLSSINTALSDVTNGASETVLINTLNPIEVQLNAHANEFIDFINGMAAIDNSLIVLPPASITVDGNEHSFFIGNTNYGVYDISSYWQFNNEHQFVGNLINPLYGNCSI